MPTNTHGACVATLALLAALSASPAAAQTPPRLPQETEPPGQSFDGERIYIANDDHTDYMWSGDVAQYRVVFQQMLDYYMTQAEQTAANPPWARGRFNCDGSLWVWEYEHSRPAADFDRLASHLADGTISMPLQTCVMLYGAMPAEAVLRNMYYAGRLERRLGLRFPLVVAMENQTMPGGVASLWAGSGAEFSWKGICGCATRIDAAHRPREIYHFVGPDGQSVCMKWNSRINPWLVGSYLEARDVHGVATYLGSDVNFAKRWPWPVTAAFGYGGDNLMSTTDAFVNASLTLSNSDRRVIVSNETDFFEDFMAHHADEIPSFSGAFGNEWDLYTASMGEVTADFKRHVEKLRAAEALATAVSLWNPAFLKGRNTSRDRAFLACGLFYEHDWTADGVVPRSARAQFQRDELAWFSGYVDKLYDDGRMVLGSLVPLPPNVERHVVFNPLSWTRTDFADLETSAAAPVHVVDVTSGLEVPSEWVMVSGAPRLRILAGDVPPVGYRVYEVIPGAGATFPPSATVSLPWLDNGRYRVTLGPRGNLTSLLDHADQDRELVAAGSSLMDAGSGNGSVTIEQQGPVSTTLRVVAGGTPAHESRVTLYAGSDRIDVEQRVTQNFGGDVEYRSAFALEGASVRHEEVGMIARVARAQQGGDYADENTRTDYLTFNHFVDLSLAGRGLTMSNWDSPFFALGSSSATVLDTTPVVSAVVGMQVDGSTYGIPDQGGDAAFLNRYALRTHGAYDPASAMRFALEHQNPLVSAPVTGQTGSPLAAGYGSLVSLPSPDVLLWALKPAEEGIDHGVIARVWNLADSPRDFELGLPGRGIASAMHATHVETDLGPAAVASGELSDHLERQQMRTYRLTPGTSVLAATDPRLTALRLRVFPNPVRAGRASSIAYTLPAPAVVRVTVHDVTGAAVATLADGALPAGEHLLRWNGRSDDGAEVRPGIYFVRLATGSRVLTGRLVRLR